MNTFFKLAYFLLFLTLSMFACEEDETLPQPQHQLEAKAGPDQQVAAGTLVTLNGSASKDGNGKSFGYNWILKTKPASSVANINGATSMTSTFIADVTGEYVVELKISNARGYATDEVKITALAPGQEPSEPAAIIISEDITEDRVLEDIFTDAALADYIVTADVVVSAKLTVKPGVRIEFEQDKGLTIHPSGALIAKGTNDGTGTHEKRVTFAGKNAVRGFWKGIAFISNNPLNEFENVTLSDAGSSSFVDLPGIKAGIIMMGSANSGAALKMTGTNVYESAGYGMYVQGMATLNKFETNAFVNNTGSAMYLPARELHKLDFFSHYSGNNGFNGVETGGVVNHASHVVWPDFNDGSGYYVSSDIIIESGVRIAEGATFEFKEETVLRVANGYLNATGTDAGKITFTAHTKSASSYWGGILFHSTSDLNRLRHTEVSYAGNKEVPFYPGLKANVAVALTAKVSVENATIQQGLGWGLLGYTDKGAQINANAPTANTFGSLVSGNYKLTSDAAYADQLAGVWLDDDSFKIGFVFDEKLYDRAANRWFGGANSPWEMSPRPGAGIKIEQDGSFIWSVYSDVEPIHNCYGTYQADYITGSVTANDNQLVFQESNWRSRFHYPCDESMNFDKELTPGSMNLRYEINKVYDQITGIPYWELTLTTASNVVLKFYRQ
ncbi:hypothetical protein [Cesiribacter sp. SM1]|uniref:PKD domain-containing protein n=1 Tax=Cesiribacter sp. SM1 TaxID=2861196 RepID=UPI001CD1A379|nr:hypothetical protein [Cesiribacter sp. SM1]